ncbi:MAG: hypothetical protein E7321_01855 [Clostridiales bacterium]|nr:hypothetical protein [Clostridiales bacterium]
MTREDAIYTLDSYINNFENGDKMFCVMLDWLSKSRGTLGDKKLIKKVRKLYDETVIGTAVLIEGLPADRRAEILSNLQSIGS